MINFRYRLATILIILAIIAGGTYLYLDSTKNRAAEEPIPVTPSTDESPQQVVSKTETAILADLKARWGSLYKDLPGVPTNGTWHITAVQFIGNNHAIVAYEDGHGAFLAVIDYRDGSFVVRKAMFDTRISFAEWQKLVEQYGNSRIEPSNYAISLLREGELVSFSALTRVPENVIASIKVKIALLAGPAKDGDGERMQGCDLVVFREIRVPATTMPLTAATKELFVKRDPWPYTESRPGNFITSQKNLSFDKATIEGGVAKIYLKGDMVLGGICDDPRMPVQIENTALQFPTVKSVEIFLNGALRWKSGQPYSNESGY